MKHIDLFSGIGGCNCTNFIKDVKNIIPASFLLKSQEEKIKYIEKPKPQLDSL
jgi:hypothetical protein